MSAAKPQNKRNPPYVKEPREEPQDGQLANSQNRARSTFSYSLDGKSSGAQAANGGDDATEDTLDWLKFENIEDLTDIEPERVIEGLLRIGEKLGITSGSKSFKTWLLLYIGYCIANGLDCMGFKTNTSKVIVFDLELSAYSLKRRLLRIQKELGTGDFKNIKACSLRGKASKFCRNFGKAQEMIIEGGFKVVIIDPAYKFLLGQDQNSNGVVADMLDRMTVFCMEANVALIYVHHHSKGNQAEKDPLDRGSGAGAWARDPDALLELVKHRISLMRIESIPVR